ncbi:beta-lactamase [Colletotrichum truncatum]|uniref:Beta-lactamase n=1 Tax=Colletotrichum truncatum TaxID=5467 RepID=A0ACC3YZK5_COLTU|nr:beta-lactamase [Colletotrichum truncatum]KAF6782067.1 beta-lactamase [Colletotrichum truncatum]
MHFHSVLSLLSLCLLCASSLAAPEARQLAAQPADVQTYFDLDGPANEIKVEELKKSGYRIISLSSYGTPPHHRYATVWVKREGSPFITIFGADAITYSRWMEAWRYRGYVSTHISVTGPAESAVYAGVMEKTNVGRWRQSCDLTDPEAFHTGRNLRMILKDLSTYGTPTDRRYCVIVHENIGNEMESIFYVTNGPSGFTDIYDSELTKTFWRPAHLFVSDDHVIAPHFRGDSVGEWVAKTNLDAKQLAAEIESQKSQGRLYPIHLEGGGAGNDVKFSVIFAENDIPEARKWTVTGNGGLEPKTTEKLDSIMKGWMQKNGVRQAQVAAAIEGEIITERGYTWAESNRAIVQPDDVFLMASISKMFAHAAAYNLIQAGKLDYSTRVLPLLGYNQPKDPRALDITINHLLTHSTGSDRDISGDTGFLFRNASELLYNGERPANLRDMIEYQLTKELDFNPGERFSYTNYGFMLLSYVVSNITEKPYFEFLKENIFGGLDIRVYETDAKKHVGDRITQDTQLTGLSGLNPKSSQNVSMVFGGDGAIKEECDGTFSLAASASSIAKFIGSHAVWGTGGRAVGKRQGTLPGARAFVASEPNGIDWVVITNTRDFVTPQEVLDLRFKMLAPLFGTSDSCFSWLRRLCSAS